MKSILLHTCCAPCSAAIIEWLLNNDFKPILYYYNPNIYPEEEYLIRKNECTRYALSLGLDIIDGDYAHAAWLDCVRGLEQEPERGARCMQCFQLRMNKSAEKANELGINLFATTLASSRWKNLNQISEAGRVAAERFPAVYFYDKNWRRGGLQERRNILLKQNGFYNQLYCGCEFSMRTSDNKKM